MLDNALSGSSGSDCPYSLNPSLYLWDEPRLCTQCTKTTWKWTKNTPIGRKNNHGASGKIAEIHLYVRESEEREGEREREGGGDDGPQETADSLQLSVSPHLHNHKASWVLQLCQYCANGPHISV